MDSILYNEILDDYLLPFVREKYFNQEYYLHQDNDPKHCSILCRSFLEDNNIIWVTNIIKKIINNML